MHPGGQVTYQLVVHNRGPGQATGVTLVDPAPSGLIFRQAHPSHGRCTIGRELRCQLGTVPAGGEALVQVIATVAADASGTITNAATVWANQGDPHPANDTATSIVHVAAGAQLVSDLRIQLHAPASGRVGQRDTFTIRLTNQGPHPAGGVSVTFTASLRLRIISAHTVHGSCTATLPVRCELGTLPVGGRVTLRIVAVPQVSGVLRTTAAVMSTSLDHAPGNNIATATTTILPARTPRPTPPTPTPPSFTG